MTQLNRVVRRGDRGPATTFHPGDGEDHHPGRTQSHPQAPNQALGRTWRYLGASALLVATCVLSACGDFSGTSGGEPGGGGNGGVTRRAGEKGSGVVNSFFVQNDASIVRNETMQASVPFAKGQFANLDRVGVQGLATAWRVLQRWGDGSVKVAQAQFTDEIPANTKKVYEVVQNVSTLKGPFQQNSWVAAMIQGLVVRVQVTDDMDVTYSADLNSATPETLQESFLVRERRWRVYMRNPNPNAGIKRDFLAARIYIKEFRDTPFMSLEVVVGNDYLGSDDPKGSKDPNLYPLGPVSFKKIDISLRGAWNGMRYYAQQGYPKRTFEQSTGLDHYTVLENTWFDDGQTKHYGFDLYFDNLSGNKEARDNWRAIFQARGATPLRPLASRKAWQTTEALGINGGPVTGPTDSWQRAERDLMSWRSRDHFGPFGTWGDAKGTSTTGTPRNAPVSPDLGHAIQGENPHLLEVLEGMATQQSVRQYHMWGLKVGDEDNFYLWNGVPYTKGSRKLSGNNLGRWDMWQNDPYASWRTKVQFGYESTGHGWNPFDAEHWTTDLLFDYYTVTGSCWALDEMKMMGQCLKGLMRLKVYFTSGMQSARAEGWTLCGFIQIWLATGDDDYKNYALRRINEVVEPQRKKDHPAKALTWQWDHPLTKYPVSTAFYMPWQHGPVLLGFSAAYEYWGSTVAKKIAEDVVTAVEYASVINFQNDPKYGTVAQGLRYYVPVVHNQQQVPASYFDRTAGIGVRWGDSPLGGAHQFLISGLYIVADRTGDKALRDRALILADRLLGKVDANRNRLWDKWTLATPDHMLPAQN